MNLLPIVERELRASARHPFTFHLRTLGVAALLLASLVFILRHGSEPNAGGKLFGNLHFTFFCAIWVCAPVLTADCLSRERREGTLGLLFLTRLRAGDIVVAKSLAQGLRALTLWLAVLPVLTIPFLLGGISWYEAGLSVLLNFSAMCLGLAAGLLASSLSRSSTRVLICAPCLSLGLGVLFMLVHLLIVAVSLLSPLVALQRFFHKEPFDSLLRESIRVATDPDGWWGLALGRMGTAARTHWLLGSAAASLFALLGLLLAIRFAAWRVRRVWQEEPPSARLRWLEDKFCKPIFFQTLFRRWMRSKLERNPVGWLEQRTWSARLVSWGWLGVIVCIYCAMLTWTRTDNLSVTHEIMSWLLAGSMALSAAGSFRRERETGMLELLLVAPLRESGIIAGRLRGLWAQFLPAAGLLLLVWLYLAALFPATGFLSTGPYQARDERGVILFYASAFLTMPVIGLYYSLRCRSVIAAFLAALAVGLLLPPLLSGLIGWTWQLYFGNSVFYSWQILPSRRAALCQLLLAGWCWNRLLRRLKRRAFPLEQPAK